MAAASGLAGSSRAPEIPASSSWLPTLAESLRMLSALVTYLRIWVDFWAATQLLATKKMKEKQRTSNSTLPNSVNHGGKARWRRSRPEEEARPEPPPEPAGLLTRRTFSPDLWDLRSTNNPLHRDQKRPAPVARRGGTIIVGEGGLEPPRPPGH